MSYTPESINIPAFEDALEESRRIRQQEAETTKRTAEAYFQGWSACADHVSGMLHCANYEDQKAETASYLRGVDHALYRLCKELDVPSDDIRKDENLSIDDKVSRIAVRIRNIAQTK